MSSLRGLDGEVNGNPLQCSCLENLRDGGAWWAAVYGVAQSRTRLKRLSSSSSSSSRGLEARSLKGRFISNISNFWRFWRRIHTMPLLHWQADSLPLVPPGNPLGTSRSTSFSTGGCLGVPWLAGDLSSLCFSSHCLFPSITSPFLF